MHFLDSSFLADYLQGEGYTEAYLEEHADVPYFAPSVVTLELAYGALNHPDPERALQTVARALSWLEVTPFDEDAAVEAAEIRRELDLAGTPIPTQDVMIAGVVRDAGGTLVTRDGDFTQVEGLDVVLLER